MKLYLCFVLLILVGNTRASFFRDDTEDESSEEMHNRDGPAAQTVQPQPLISPNQIFFPDAILNLPVVQPDPDAYDYGTDTNTSIVIQDPIRIAIFNSGDYDANIKLNYIIDDLQDEDTIETKIVKMQERDIFLPRIATNIRIRVVQVGVFSDSVIIDWQIYSLQNFDITCILLAGTRWVPIYGQCGLPYDDMVTAWTR